MVRFAVVAALVLAASSAASPTQTIRLSQLGLVFTLPSSWSGSSTGLRFDGRAPGRVAQLTVQEVKTSSPLSAIATNFVDAERKQLAKTDPHATVVRQNTKLSSGPAVKVTLRYRGLWFDRTGEITDVVYTFKHGNRAYVFDYSAVGTWAAKEKATFDASIQSVRFLGAQAA
jgi:hypothetical protein